MRRYAPRDDQWDPIQGREGHVGGTAADNSLFVEAVLFTTPRRLVRNWCWHRKVHRGVLEALVGQAEALASRVLKDRRLAGRPSPLAGSETPTLHPGALMGRRFRPCPRFLKKGDGVLGMSREARLVVMDWPRQSAIW
jgi:hypothetical protein